MPAGRHPVCPNDEHRHGDSTRGYATRAATTPAARRHDGTCDNDDGARTCTRASTPGNSARRFAIAGAVTSYDDYDHYDLDPGFDREG